MRETDKHVCALTGEYCALTELLPQLRAQVATEQQKLENIRSSIASLSNQSGSYFSGTEPDDDDDVTDDELTSAGSSLQTQTVWEQEEPESDLLPASVKALPIAKKVEHAGRESASSGEQKKPRHGPFADPQFPKFNSLAKRLDHAARQCFLDASKDIQGRVKEVVESRQTYAVVKNPSSFLTSLVTAERMERLTPASDSRPSELTAFEHLDIDRRARRKLRSLSARKRRQIKQHITDSPGLRNPSAMVMFLCSQLE